MHLLTIAIPTKNRGKFIGLILSELSKQIIEEKLSNIVNVIISDNASSDDTVNVVAPFTKHNKNFFYIKQKFDVGIDGNVRYLIKIAQGKFIWFLGDDDSIYPGAVKKVHQTLRENINCGGMLFGYDIYDKTLGKFQKHMRPKNKGLVYKKDFLRNDFFLNSFISITIIKKPYSNSKKFNEQTTRWCGSLYLHSAIQLMQADKGIFISQECLVKFRSGMSELGAPILASIMPTIIALSNKEALNLYQRTQIQNYACRKNLLPYLLTRKLGNGMKIDEIYLIFKFHYLAISFWLIFLPMYIVPTLVYKLLNKIRKLILIIFGLRK